MKEREVGERREAEREREVVKEKKSLLFFCLWQK
jgi:hypothetical protein